jgi:ubiquinone/menaquinone biosynthesis C-methylase UbiE
VAAPSLPGFSMTERSSARPWFFDVWSRFYDQSVVQRLVYRPVHDAILRELKLIRPDRVLDLGCGTGLLTERVRRELGVPSVVGADYSPGMLEQAATGRPDIDWVLASATSLPLADASFDAIVSSEAFHWFPDQPAALAECRRILRPGGGLLVAFVNPDFELVGSAAHSISSTLGQPARWPTAQRMRSLVDDAGLSVRSQQRVFRPAGFLLLAPVLTVADRA